jgi:hypothetical protein
MTQDTVNILISGLMGLVGGLITLPINALFSWMLKKEELNLQSKLKAREMQLQIQLDIKKEKELQRLRQNEISDIKSRIENLENSISRLSSNGN